MKIPKVPKMRGLMWQTKFAVTTKCDKRYISQALGNHDFNFQTFWTEETKIVSQWALKELTTRSFQNYLKLKLLLSYLQKNSEINFFQSWLEVTDKRLSIVFNPFELHSSSTNKCDVWV